jgi:hypothetical protein
MLLFILEWIGGVVVIGLLAVVVWEKFVCDRESAFFDDDEPFFRSDR